MEGDNGSVSEVKEWGRTEQIRREGEKRESGGEETKGGKLVMTIMGGNGRESNDRTQRKQGRGKERRVLMEGDISRSHKMTGVKKVHSTTFLCIRETNK